MTGRSARKAENDLETEERVKNLVAIRDILKTKLLRALIDSLSLSPSNSSWCHHSTN